ncbi:major facilitator superfamily MFS_1 [mine drainage metagenome]|uniref:Major facilitator superfamily MFS_1 n=1 Tax=mine drainage metagenome TaxID=410659 RepID=T1BWU7_9ZZZZ
MIRKDSIFFLTVLFFTISVPVEFAAASSSPFITVTALSIQAFFEGAIFSVIPIFMAEKFSKKFRTTGIGIVYSLGGTIGSFGLTLTVTFWKLWNNFIASWIFVSLTATIVLLIGTAITKETLKTNNLEMNEIMDPIRQ